MANGQQYITVGRRPTIKAQELFNKAHKKNQGIKPVENKILDLFQQGLGLFSVLVKPDECYDSYITLAAICTENPVISSTAPI